MRLYEYIHIQSSSVKFEYRDIARIRKKYYCATLQQNAVLEYGVIICSHLIGDVVITHITTELRYLYFIVNKN